MVAAHPKVPVPGCAWEFGYDDVDAVEVWNSRWSLDDQATLRVWDRLLRQGRRIVAVANSDSHSHADPIGSPHTVVRADELSTPAILAGLRQGRAYLAGSAGVTLDLTATADGRTAGIGDMLRTGHDVEVTATVRARRGRC